MSLHDRALADLHAEACAECAGLGRLVTHRDVIIGGAPGRLSDVRECRTCEGSGFRRVTASQYRPDDRGPRERLQAALELREGNAP